MAHKQRRYHSFSSARAPQRVLHFILYYLMSRHLSAMGSPLQKGNRKRHPQMKNHLSTVSNPDGEALCLLKTQFAKKPKNPV